LKKIIDKTLLEGREDEIIMFIIGVVELINNFNDFLDEKSVTIGKNNLESPV